MSIDVAGLTRRTDDRLLLGAGMRERAAAQLRTFRLPIAIFVGLWFVLTVVVWQSYQHFERGDTAFRPRISADEVLGGWMWGDAVWYVSIADDGYFYIPDEQSPVAFFPSYPLTVRAATSVIEPTALAALVVTTLSGFAAALLFWQWCGRHLSGRARLAAFLALLCFPYAWYLYGTGYADALFLLATLAAFTLMERRQPLLAGLCGAVATAARPVGVSVVAALVVMAWLQHREQAPPRRIGAGIVAPIVAVGGLGAWCTYLWVRFGDPMAFAAVEGARGWDQPPGMRTWLKERFFWQIQHGNPSFTLRLLPHAILTIGALFLIPAVFRRFGAAYGFYTLAVVGIAATGTGTFMGCARYLLVAFPLFGVVGPWLAQRLWVGRVALVASAGSLVVLTSYFARGYYLS